MAMIARSVVSDRKLTTLPGTSRAVNQPMPSPVDSASAR